MSRPDDPRPETQPPDDPEVTPTPDPRQKHKHHGRPTTAARWSSALRNVAKIVGAVVVLLTSTGAGTFTGYKKGAAEREDRIAEVEQLLMQHVKDEQASREVASSELWAERAARADLQLKTSNDITALQTTIGFMRQEISDLRSDGQRRRQPRRAPVSFPSRPK